MIDGERWRRRWWNNAFVAEHAVDSGPDGYAYRVRERATRAQLLCGHASGMTPERLERVLEGDLRTLAARSTREVPQVP